MKNCKDIIPLPGRCTAIDFATIDKILTLDIIPYNIGFVNKTGLQTIFQQYQYYPNTKRIYQTVRVPIFSNYDTKFIIFMWYDEKIARDEIKILGVYDINKFLLGMYNELTFRFELDVNGIFQMEICDQGGRKYEKVEKSNEYGGCKCLNDVAIIGDRVIYTNVDKEKPQ